MPTGSKREEAPHPPPPRPFTDQELIDAGYDLFATPMENANCPTSVTAQLETNRPFNWQLWERYLEAKKTYDETKQGEKPKGPRRPVLTASEYEDDCPYYRMEDLHAMLVICHNDKTVPYPPDYNY